MPPTRRRAAAARLAAGVTLAGLVLAGCVAPKEQTTPRDLSDVPPEVAEEGVQAYYDQDVDWTECGELECATVLAPLDWDDAEAGTIELAMSRSRARGPESERVGSLLVNPGGPGVSGVEFLPLALKSFGKPLLEAYDVVGFDPRGVGDSTAVDCGGDSVLDEYFVTELPQGEGARKEIAEHVEAFGEACLDATGELLGEVDTVSSARDLDLLRGVLGDDELYYAGFSYGTFLGATYADLFPERVGRLLLDGAMDPSLSGLEVSLEQAEGFETAARAYVEDCRGGADCPLRGDDADDGLEHIARLLEEARRTPFRAEGDLTVNSRMLSYGIAVALYDESSWSTLTMAFEELVRTDRASLFLELANFYLDRSAEGEWSTNTMAAFQAINCLDYPAEDLSPAERDALEAEARERAPVFGQDFLAESGCPGWPFEPRAERREITAEGAEPILVVGTTRDPATPYQWAESLAEQLESGVLLTYEGDGHTAYGRSNDCVADVVEAYLVDGKVPEDGVTC